MSQIAIFSSSGELPTPFQSSRLARSAHWAHKPASRQWHTIPRLAFKDRPQAPCLLLACRRELGVDDRVFLVDLASVSRPGGVA